MKKNESQMMVKAKEETNDDIETETDFEVKIFF